MQSGHPVLDFLDRPIVRMAMAGGIVLLGLALGGLALAGRGSADASVDGPGLVVAVVTTPERSVQPGEVMDVGQLTDEFDGSVPRPQPAETANDYWVEQPAYVEAEWVSAPPARARDDEPARPVSEPARNDRSRTDEPYGDPRAFGFDMPRPDYRAEREARRSAMEARMAEAERDRDRARNYGDSEPMDNLRPYDSDR